jgi:hypothetical protein
MIETENVVPLRELCKLIPPMPRPNGQPWRPGMKTLYKWSVQGIRGAVLETVQRGATRCSSLEAYYRFCAAITKVRDERRQEQAKQPAVQQPAA